MPENTDHPVRLYAAGSLESAMERIIAAFAEAGYGPAEGTYGPSGLLRQRIEAGDPADVFASADMAQPRTLAGSGLGGPVVRFARNELWALTRPGLGIPTEDLLDRLLDPGVRVGTSTPGADPSGDYARAVFERAEAVRPGSCEALEGKALRLTGGPDIPEPPVGRNRYAWVLTEDRADVFLTYRTNALLARRDTPELGIVELPQELAVGADYGLSLLRPDNPAAVRLALFVLSPEGQAILVEEGFTSSERS